MRYLLILTICLLQSTLAAQTGLGQLFVRGQIEPESGTLPDRMSVELVDERSHLTVNRQPVMTDGSFEFQSVRPGEYELHIDNAYGSVIRREFVSIHNEGPLEIKLPVPAANRPVSGTISAASLGRHVSAKARREVARSERDLHDGDLSGSIAHLEKAIQIQPDYMEAHNDLGIRYLTLRQFDRSVAEFNEALQLDPNSSFAHANLGLALLSLQRLPQAEAELRRAVQIDASLSKAHYLLALALIDENKDAKEVLQHLDRAAAEIPKARPLAAQIRALMNLPLP